MKKIFSAIAVILGLILAAAGIQWKMKEAVSIGIIGGADGPTAVFVAGKAGGGMAVGAVAIGAVAIGVVLIAAGVVIYKMMKRK